MKIGLFTDAHYSSAELTCGCRYNNQSLRKIKEAYEYFEKEKCDFVICLGDLTDSELSHEDEILRLKEIAELIRVYKMQTYVLMGNHDAFCFKQEEFYAILGEECKPVDLYQEQKALFFLDACYTKAGNRYLPPEGDWTDTCLPHLDTLAEKLEQADGRDVYVFIHQNVDPEVQEDYLVFNAGEFRAMIEKSGNVKMVYQGHYHAGKTTVHNGIRYITLPAMCQNEKAYYILEIE